MVQTGRHSAGAAEEFSIMLGLKAYKREFMRLVAVGTVAVAAGACSSLPTVPDWVDPTNWFGDDSQAQADNGQTPDLASIPDKPATTTPDDQKDVAESLGADRSHATYSADALRGGTEAAAPPPPNIEPAQVASDVLPGSESDQAARPKKATAAAAAPAPVPVQTAQVDRSVSRDPTGPSMPGTLPAPSQSEMLASAAPPPSSEPSSSLTAGTEAVPAPAPSVAPPPVATASVVPPSTPVQSASLSEPAPAPVMVPAPQPVKVARAPVMPPMQRVASIPPSDAALGFKPSSAPPLDPSVSQFVAPSIIQHYRQTASEAGMYSSGVPVRMATAKAPRKVARRHSRGVAMGGPEHMTGAVVANLDALQQPALPPVEAAPVYTDAQGSTAAAVVYFPGDATRLSAKTRAQVRSVVEQFKASGSQGFIKVVGHSSSRTPNMSAERHAQVVFEKSQLRADAVAQEIIREGVPAAKVLVDAVGDSQPVYYESMPKGEDGNRRAEIFLQG
jgi:outer membrane protein OmpA-like peptidoglycan-associated protein